MPIYKTRHNLTHFDKVVLTRTPGSTTKTGPMAQNSRPSPRTGSW